MEVISSIKKTDTNSKTKFTNMSNSSFEVIVIEDNHLINTIMSKALESTINTIKNLINIPVTFSSFHNGGDFLNYFESRDINNLNLIVFSDYHLEDNMNGVEILKNIKRRKSDATVIIMSDSANEQISNDSLKYGAYCFLRKDAKTTVICSELLFQMVV
jgi:DNA-binding NarL/FixJ family response regulator